MNIISIAFGLVFCFFLYGYAVLRGLSRTWLMLYVIAASLLYFYLANGWLMLLLPATALVSWGISRLLLRQNRCRKLLLTVGVLADLAPLLYYKYSNFGIETINAIFATNFSLLSIALPIGISFYTFQAISHLVDVYRGRFREDVSLLEYGFYISFFPLLLAGPITRAGYLIPQLRRHDASGKWAMPVNTHMLYMGLWLILLGLLKKAVVADYIAQYNNWIFDDPAAYSGFENLMGIIGYAVQIYCDFSGYSDLSIGMAGLMGIRLPDNFRVPYRSENVTEFWHRWHISLSTCFRDYVYIPLGGNRKGKFRTYLNNIITMLVAGLWHGATWMFVIWGGMHGLALILHKMNQPWLRRIPNTWYVRTLSWLLTFVFLGVTWVFFRATSMETALTLLQHATLDVNWGYLWPFMTARPVWTAMVVLLLLMHAVPEKRYSRLRTRFVCCPWYIKLIIVFVVFQLVVQFHTSNVQPFIYSQF